MLQGEITVPLTADPPGMFVLNVVLMTSLPGLCQRLLNTFCTSSIAAIYKVDDPPSHGTSQVTFKLDAILHDH